MSADTRETPRDRRKRSAGVEISIRAVIAVSPVSGCRIIARLSRSGNAFYTVFKLTCIVIFRPDTIIIAIIIIIIFHCCCSTVARLYNRSRIPSEMTLGGFFLAERFHEHTDITRTVRDSRIYICMHYNTYTVKPPDSGR